MDLNWPQLLQDLGPFALLPFSVIVIERLAAARARDQKLPENTRKRVYAFAWILIFVLCVTVVIAWFMSRTSKSEAMLHGLITGLGSRQQLRATGPERANVRVFTYRDPQEPDRLFWRAFSQDPLDEATELRFLINTSTQDGDHTFGYPFQARRNFYDYAQDLVFKYDSAKNIIVFDNPVSGKKDELNAEPIVIASNAPSMFEQAISRLPGFAVLMAQSPARQQPVAALIENLESDDVLVRLAARRQLAARGPEAKTAMENALVNPASSYRARLGVIVAANQMTGVKADSFTPAAWCGVWKASQSADDTLKTQANLLLKKPATPIDLSSCKTPQAPVQPTVRPPVKPTARQPVR
jgi:hypothetical protein